jgi:ubiquinone/menaquinone biosynthesis C-methylase UbiE
MKAETVKASGVASQCQKPAGWLGRLMLWNMNSRHSKVTDWGLGHVSVASNSTILDVGCGGGRTLGKLAVMAPQAKVYGVDHSEESVATSKRANAPLIREGRIEVHHGLVSRLPFQDGMFDLVTAVETHFWWPNLPTDMREVFRVVKSGGSFVVIAEIYKGANTTIARLADRCAQMGMTILDVNEHRELFTQSGYTDVRIATDPNKGWICGLGRKP